MTEIFDRSDNVHLPFLVSHITNVDQWRAHRAVVWLSVFGGLLHRSIARYDFGSVAPLGGARNTGQKLFLCQQSFVSLAPAQLFETIADDYLVEAPELCLHHREHG